MAATLYNHGAQCCGQGGHCFTCGKIVESAKDQKVKEYRIAAVLSKSLQDVRGQPFASADLEPYTMSACHFTGITLAQAGNAVHDWIHGLLGDKNMQKAAEQFRQQFMIHPSRGRCKIAIKILRVRHPDEGITLLFNCYKF